MYGAVYGTASDVPCDTAIFKIYPVGIYADLCGSGCSQTLQQAAEAAVCDPAGIWRIVIS